MSLRHDSPDRLGLTPFGKALRRFRIKIDCTMGEMAGRLSISPAYLSSIETGRREVSESFLADLKREFGALGVGEAVDCLEDSLLSKAIDKEILRTNERKSEEFLMTVRGEFDISEKEVVKLEMLLGVKNGKG